MKIYKLVIFAACYTLFSSCEKNVLDKDPLSQIDEDLVWQDINLATLYVNNFYLALPGGAQRALDCATETGEQGHNWMDTQSWNAGDISAGYAPFQGEWYNCYTQIRNANIFLQKYVSLTGDETAISQLKGQALFMRAYYYTELVNLFGGVPLIKEPQSLEDSLFVPKSSYDDCVEFIVSDLDEAAGLLPETWDGGDIGRATKGACLALKSRLLLYAASLLHNPGNNASEWQKAADAAKAVIDLGIYSLYPDYYGLFHVDNNEEVIFDIQYAYPTRTQNAEYWLNPQGLQGAFGAMRPTQEMVDYYEMSNGKAITDAGSGYDAKNPYQDRDPRFYASVLYNGAPWRGGEVETYFDGANGPGQFDQYATSAAMTGYYIRKFINESNPVAGVDKANENWILMRYAEVLLNYAEAQVALGNDAEARAYINMVRKRSGMPDLPASLSGSALLERCRNERAVELCFEELHFFDVRRWKTAPGVLGVPVHKMDIKKLSANEFSYTVKEMEERVWRDAFYYLPIPQDEINKNPNLVQNEGY